MHPLDCATAIGNDKSSENRAVVSAKFEDFRSRSAGRERTSAPAGPAPSEVAAFLEQHPNFLNERPELLEALTPPATRNGRRVLDMQYFMVARLQRTLHEVREREADLVEATRTGRSQTARIHAAVLALCEPHALDNLMEIISNDLPTLLETDVVVIGVEAGEEQRRGALHSTLGVYLLGDGAVDRLLNGKDVLLDAAYDTDSTLFGGAATLVKSTALLRLRLGRPGRPALLALGSRDPARFQPGQSTEMLTFLAEALGRRMREWLDWAF